MPRYIFDIHDDKGRPSRAEATYADPEQARAAEVTEVGEAIKDLGAKFWKESTWRIDVTDKDGAAVCWLCFKGDMV